MLRFYLTPHEIKPESRQPKYFGDLDGIEAGADFNGLASTALVACDLTEFDHDFVASMPDVLALPPDLDTAMGGAAADAINQWMEGHHIALSLAGSNTVRQALRKIRIAFRLGWRLALTGDEPMEAPDRNTLSAGLSSASAPASWVTPSLTWRGHMQLNRNMIIALNSYDRRLARFPAERPLPAQLNMIRGRMDTHKVPHDWMADADGGQIAGLVSVTNPHHVNVGNFWSRFLVAKPGTNLETRLTDLPLAYRQNIEACGLQYGINLAPITGAQTLRNIYSRFIAEFPTTVVFKLRETF